MLPFLALCPFKAPVRLPFEPLISGGRCVITDSLRLFLNRYSEYTRLSSLGFTYVGHLKLVVEWRLISDRTHLPGDLLLSTHPTDCYDSCLILHLLSPRLLRIELVVQVVVELRVQSLLQITLCPHLRFDLLH